MFLFGFLVRGEHIGVKRKKAAKNHFSLFFPLVRSRNRIGKRMSSFMEVEDALGVWKFLSTLEDRKPKTRDHALASAGKPKSR